MVFFDDFTSRYICFLINEQTEFNEANSKWNELKSNLNSNENDTANGKMISRKENGFIFIVLFCCARFGMIHWFHGVARKFEMSKQWYTRVQLNSVQFDNNWLIEADNHDVLLKVTKIPIHKSNVLESILSLIYFLYFDLLNGSKKWPIILRYSGQILDSGDVGHFANILIDE